MNPSMQTAIPEPANQASLISPREFFMWLSEFAVAQEEAKIILSTIAYIHRQNALSAVPLFNDRLNIILFGPTGCGKTLLARTLATITGLPIAFMDATSLSQAGYVGEHVWLAFYRLWLAAGRNTAQAEKGIIYIDEFDKLSPKYAYSLGAEAVQRELLTIIEGTAIRFPETGSYHSTYYNMVSIRTHGILVILGGAFCGIEDVIAKRLKISSARIGFAINGPKDKNQPASDPQPHKESFLSRALAEDFIRYGILPELAGRIAVLVPLARLSQSELKRILLKPKGTIIPKIKTLLYRRGIRIEFDESALDYIVCEALKLGTGARALNSILIKPMLRLFYEISDKNAPGQVLVVDRSRLVEVIEKEDYAGDLKAHLLDRLEGAPQAE